MKVIFTKHAEKKFFDLSKLGVNIKKQKVVATINNPEHIDKEEDYPNIISSAKLDKTRIVRVVYKQEDDIIKVITFYPAKKGRYY